MSDFPYVLLERATGRIVSICSSSTRMGEGRAESMFPDLDILHAEATNMHDWFVVADKIEPRPTLPIRLSQSTLIANGVDEMVLSGFPDPSNVTVNGKKIALIGGELALSADTPAVYRVECRHWPYLDWNVDIEAKEAQT